MKVGIFICDSYPDDYYLSAAIGEFAWMIDDPIPVGCDISGPYSVEFNRDALPADPQELKDYLEASGFINVELV